MIDYNHVLPVVYEEARETGAVVDDPGEDFVPTGQDQHEAGQERQVETLSWNMLMVKIFFKQF